MEGALRDAPLATENDFIKHGGIERDRNMPAEGLHAQNAASA
eukprot:CAMPEP_0183445036 /NCGR_PEP_ID=MMETSP0370-20130417/96074_1 /TAXON_ID=268820 /ORGANISM="Peridinium aciculiferum, Strain PAER-2" /LENGTH=41 /DNA_ID= /DNA_START= /DNA_END= /DNA_ORIENTATION=